MLTTKHGTWQGYSSSSSNTLMRSHFCGSFITKDKIDSKVMLDHKTSPRTEQQTHRLLTQIPVYQIHSP